MRSSFLRLWLLRQALSLPPAVLRFFAGGGVVHVAGRTLDAQVQFLWRGWFAGQGEHVFLGLTDVSLEQARKEWLDLVSLFGLPPRIKVKVEDIGFEPVGSPYGSLPAKGVLIRPAQIANDAPLLVFFPQGGGVLGGPELSKAFCALFAHEARCPVFIPEHRLAPANRFPAAYEDARNAFEWAQNNAFRLGAKTGEVAVGGTLTGAALAARLCLDLKRDFKPLPKAQLLLAPLLDLSDVKAKSGGQWPLTGEDLDVLIGHYAGAGSDLTDPNISPALEKLIIGQPRTMVVSAGLDPLAAQGETFVHRLIAARTRVVYRRYDTLPLGFDLFPGVVDDAHEAVGDMARNWIELLRTSHAEAEADAQNVA